jgi:hypothetical protein
MNYLSDAAACLRVFGAAADDEKQGQAEKPTYEKKRPHSVHGLGQFLCCSNIHGTRTRFSSCHHRFTTLTAFRNLKSKFSDLCINACIRVIKRTEISCTGQRYAVCLCVCVCVCERERERERERNICR